MLRCAPLKVLTTYVAATQSTTLLIATCNKPRIFAHLIKHIRVHIVASSRAYTGTVRCTRVVYSTNTHIASAKNNIVYLYSSWIPVCIYMLCMYLYVSRECMLCGSWFSKWSLFSDQIHVYARDTRAFYARTGCSFLQFAIQSCAGGGLAWTVK